MKREILDFCINLLFWWRAPEQWWGESQAKSQHQSSAKGRVSQLTLCTEHLKIAMSVSWPSTELSSLHANISTDLIPANGGHEVKWNGIHLKFLLHMRLEGWLSTCQATWKQPGLVFTQKCKIQLPWCKKLTEFLSYPEKEALNLSQYGQIFNKMSCNSGFLINFFVLALKENWESSSLITDITS